MGAVVKIAEKLSMKLDNLPLEEVQSVHKAFGPDWIKVFDLDRAMAMRTGTGMPGKAQTKKQFARWKKLLAE